MKCVVCGCTDRDCSGCTERTGLPCSWAMPEVCSACLTGFERVVYRGRKAWLGWNLRPPTNDLISAIVLERSDAGRALDMIESAIGADVWRLVKKWKPYR